MNDLKRRIKKKGRKWSLVPHHSLREDNHDSHPPLRSDCMALAVFHSTSLLNENQAPNSTLYIKKNNEQLPSVERCNEAVLNKPLRLEMNDHRE